MQKRPPQPCTAADQVRLRDQTHDLVLTVDYRDRGDAMFGEEFGQYLERGRLSCRDCDGHNDSDASGTMASLARGIAQTSSSRPIRVFNLTYGRDADVTTLQRVSGLTGAHYYDATDPDMIGEVLSDLVADF